MSLSKLESLSNETLIDLIENYINGIDILVAFHYQLNRRFDGLIAQCHRFRFNFIQCRKDDFRFCMGLLPAYVDRIQELRLSEKDTPGQIHAFLSFFPNFMIFRQLHTLCLHFDGNAVDKRKLLLALHSLYVTKITILSIQMVNYDDVYSFNRLLPVIFELKTLKRFALSTNRINDNWDFLSNTTSNIEYLSIPGRHFEFHQLHAILQWAPHLKYLDIGIVYNGVYHPDYNDGILKKNITSTFGLRTLILSVDPSSKITLDMLEPYFRIMPALNYLEIKAGRTLTNDDAWELLLTTSLPSLKNFTLQAFISFSKTMENRSLIASFQSSFWLTRENFNVLIADCESFNFDSLISNMARQDLDLNNFSKPSIKFLVTPVRPFSNSFSMIKEITNLSLSTESNILMCQHYFQNIKCLKVDNMNKTLLKWMTTYVNCSTIMELYILSSSLNTNELDLLLTSIPHINSLHLRLNLLLDNRDVFVRKINDLKRFDISVDKHQFNEECIRIIANLFPYIEHLQINTNDIHYIPLLQIYLPYLRSISVNSSSDFPQFGDIHSKHTWSTELRTKNEFLFEFTNGYLTIWIDENAYRQPYWYKNASKASKSTVKSRPSGTPDNKKTNKKGIFSFFKLFK